MSLPVPVSAGAGAAVDVSALGKDKTIIVGATVAYTGLVLVETSLDNVVFAPLLSLNRPDLLQVPVVSRYMRVRAEGELFDGTAVTAHVGGITAANVFVEIPLPVAGNGLGDPVDISALGSFQTYQTKMLANAELEVGTLSILARGGGSGGFVPIGTFARGGFFNMRGFTVEYVRSYGRGFASVTQLAGYTLNVGAQTDCDCEEAGEDQ